jgi:hypothetical protein
VNDDDSTNHEQASKHAITTDEWLDNFGPAPEEEVDIGGNHAAAGAWACRERLYTTPDTHPYGGNIHEPGGEFGGKSEG